jgi:branched-chain amino acid transport system ATP-binding protein
MSRVLDLAGVDAAYGPVQALFALNLPIVEGKVTAVLGPNGAGKTTALRVAAGLLAPLRGTVSLRGTDVTGKAPRQIARSGLCLIPEGRGTFPSLTVRENLLLQCSLAHKKMSQVEEVAYGRFPVLGKRRHQSAGTLSGGEQHMLALSRALTTDPQVILIDEISMGLAPIVVERLFDSVTEIAKEGRTVVLVEQLAELVLEISDFVAVISKGTVVKLGQPGDVQDELKEIYLGADVRAEAGARVTDDAGMWKTPTGTLAHRGDCPVVVSRPDVRPVTAGDGLTDCGICTVTGSTGTGSTGTGTGEHS